MAHVGWVGLCLRLVTALPLLLKRGKNITSELFILGVVPHLLLLLLLLFWRAAAAAVPAPLAAAAATAAGRSTTPTLRR